MKEFACIECDYETDVKSEFDHHIFNEHPGEDVEEDEPISLSEADTVILQMALEYIKKTDFYKKYAEHDYDWALHKAAHGIEETLKGNWWGS